MKLIIRVGNEALLVPENALSDGDMEHIQALDFNYYSSSPRYRIDPGKELHFELVKDVLPAKEQRPCEDVVPNVTD